MPDTVVAPPVSPQVVTCGRACSGGVRTVRRLPARRELGALLTHPRGHIPDRNGFRAAGSASYRAS